MAQDSSFQIGDRIGQDGKYEIVQVLGKGGMGAVFKAFDHFLEREVAIKTILLDQDPTTTKALRERFLREARSVARVSNHPNIVQIYEVGADSERPFIAMEFIDGEDVSKLKPRLTLEQTLFICDRVASALDFIHSKGIFHRDVKPGNVMVGRQWEVKVMDFGIAKDSQRTSMTQYSMRLGSPLYMAPETLAENPVASAYSDQYALAVILYELLTMRYPFDAPEFRGLFMAICNAPPKSPRTFSPWIPVEVEAVLNRALAKDPKDRFRSCGELISEFRRALGDIQERQKALAARRADASQQWRHAQSNLDLLRSFAEQFQDWPDRSQALNRISELEEEERKRESREKIAFQTFDIARERKDVTSLNRFIERFPDSRYVPEARSEIAQLETERRLAHEAHQKEIAAYERARASRDIDVLQTFLFDYPDSQFAPEIAAITANVRADQDRIRKERQEREKKAREELRRIVAARDPAELETWLRLHGDLTELASYARQQLKLLEIEIRQREEEDRLQRELDAARVRKAFEDATLAQDVKTLEGLLVAYPDAPEVTGAREAIVKISQLERRRKAARAQEAFALAASFRDPALLRQFIEEHADSELVPKAKQLLSQIESEELEKQDRAKRTDTARQAWELAEAFRDRALLAEFLRDYPDAAQAADARLLLASLDEEASQAKARAAAEENRLKQAQSSFEHARQSRDPGALRAFLAAFPDSPSAADANSLLKGILEEQEQQAKAQAAAEERRKQAQTAFEKAKQSRDPATLRAFLSAYSDTSFVGEATKLLQTVLEEKAKQAKGKAAAEERRKQAQASFEAARQSRDAAALRTFVGAYPDTSFAAEATKLLQTILDEEARRAEAKVAAEERRKQAQASFEKAKQSRDPAALREFLSAYADTSLAAEASKLLGNILEEEASRQAKANAVAEQRQKQAQSSFEAAKRSRDPSALRAFLSEYGDSTRAADATALLREVEEWIKNGDFYFEQASASQSLQGLRDFVRDYAAHPKAPSARSRIAQLEGQDVQNEARRREEDAWARCKDSVEPSEVEQFLESFPDGTHAAEGRTRLRSLGQQRRQVLESSNPAVLNRFLSEHPQSPDRFLVQTRLAQLEQEQLAFSRLPSTEAPELGRAGEHAIPVAPPPPIPPLPPPPKPRNWLGIGAALGGLAVAIVGAYLMFRPGPPKPKPPDDININRPDGIGINEGAGDDAAWSQAQRANDPALARDYLSKFPSGRHSRDARKRIDSLVKSAKDAFDSAQRGKDPNQLEAFERSYPWSDQAKVANAAASEMRSKEDTRFREVKSAPSNDKIASFSKDFPWSTRVSELRGLGSEEDYWKSVADSRNPKDFDDFRQRYPKNAHAGEAQTKAEQLRNTERNAWGVVSKSDKPGDFDKFILDFPWSDHQSQARQSADGLRAEDAAWQSVSKTNPKDLEQFRSQHPNGRYAKEAARLTSELNNRANQQWEIAKSKNDIKDYDQFAKDFPYSDHAAEARARVEQLRKAEEARLKDEQDRKLKEAADKIAADKAAADKAAADKAAKDAADRARNEGKDTPPPPPPKLTDITGKDGLIYKGIPGRPFRIAQTETTRAAFDRFAAATSQAKATNGKSPDMPMIYITYEEAEAYCRWAGGRLPTKVEWEYAAHGGKETEYPFGDDVTKEQAQFGNQQNLAPALSHLPNGYGLYNMVGNVAEFVEGRIVKGGHHLSGKADLKISKDYGIKDGKSENNGFRCVIP